MKAVGYIRVSRVGGRAGDSFLSPDLQKEQIAAVARREGFEVVEVLPLMSPRRTYFVTA